MIASLLAVTNPGDEIVVFEPHYENYGPDTLLAGAERKFVRLHPPDWKFDPEELRRAFSPRTKAIILNSPGNPTGQVFDREQLECIAQLCQEFDALAITDEIYEHIVYDGASHIPMMTIPGMRDRTIMVNSMSKTYAVTGWRVGWVAACSDLTESIRKVHDFLTVGAAAPLQEAGAPALGRCPTNWLRPISPGTIRLGGYDARHAGPGWVPMHLRPRGRGLRGWLISPASRPASNKKRRCNLPAI